MLKRKKVLALIIAVGMTLTACGGPAADAQPAAGGGSSAGTPAGDEDYYVVGCAQPLSGNNALYGEAAYNAAALAVEKVNAAGGVNGRQIKLISYDDQGSPEEAVKIAMKMIDVDKVDAVVQSVISSCILAAGKYLNDAGVITFGTGGSPTWMAEDWPYVFRACLNTDYVMPNLVEMMQEMNLNSAAIFQGQDDAGKAAGDSFAAECKAAGITVTTVESYVEGDTDFSGQVAKMIDSGAESMFIALLGSTQPIIVKQLRQFGYEGVIINKEIFQLDGVQIAGAASDYTVFAYPYLCYDSVDDCDIPIMKEFLTLYANAYGATPTTDCAYRAWDSVMVLAEGAAIAGSNDSDALRDAIMTVSDFECLGGTFNYTAGDREGLHAFNKFVVVDQGYMLFSEWMASGGYDQLLEKN
jgi:branched-chain amino acid transport system substrate-binding protein